METIGVAADHTLDYTLRLLERLRKWWGGLREGLRNPPRRHGMHLL